MWLCSSSTSIIEDLDPSTHLNILTVRRPAELDRELPGRLSLFTESILKTATNLEELKAQHAAAVKALEAENKKKLDDKKKANALKSAAPANSNHVPEFKEGKPVFGSKVGAATAQSRSLFETTDQAEIGSIGEPPHDEEAAVERVIGTIRRECLDHVIVWSEAGLSRHLRRFVDYYHRSRTHLVLEKDTPESRPVQGPEAGRIVAIPEVGGLHHRYERCAA
jgi:hypothetical protein